MDPSLIRDADPAGVVLYFAIMLGIILGTALFNRTRRQRDWVDEAHGRGSIKDDWGLEER